MTCVICPPAQAARNPAFGGRVTFVDTLERLFVDAQGMLQLVDPDSGRLVYKDFSHVNRDGAKRAELTFREVIFGEKVCGGE